MKIYPTQQNFTHKTSINKASKKVADRMTLVAASMIATTILGSAYMCKDKDYYQTRESIKATNTIKMDHISMDALIENVGLEGLKLSTKDNKNFSYSGKIGVFTNISGNFIKNNESNQVFGTYKEDGLWNDKEYSFNLTYEDDKNKMDKYTISVEYSVPGKPESKQKYILEQEQGSYVISKDGKKMTSRDDKEASIFAAILAVLATVNILVLCSNDKK